VKYSYDAEVLDMLAGHGFAPDASTAPTFVRDALSDLYRYEIRRLRERFLRGAIPMSEYAPHVIALRRRYWLLSLPVVHWATRTDLPHPA
jgi:hypothetical protein